VISCDFVVPVPISCDLEPQNHTNQHEKKREKNKSKAKPNRHSFGQGSTHSALIAVADLCHQFGESRVVAEGVEAVVAFVVGFVFVAEFDGAV
jgi:hypothetical protein